MKIWISILAVFFGTLGQAAVAEELSIPVDGRESFYCLWRPDNLTSLVNRKGNSLNFVKVRATLKKSIDEIKLINSGSQKDKLKIAKLKATLKGVKACQDGDLGLEDGIPNIPVKPNNLVVAQALLSDNLGTAFCSVVAYKLKRVSPVEGQGGFILCKLSTPIGTNAYRIEISEIFNPGDPFKNFVINQALFVPDTSVIFPSGELCATSSPLPCVSDNAQEFVDLMKSSSLNFALEISALNRELVGNLGCVVGC